MDNQEIWLLAQSSMSDTNLVEKILYPKNDERGIISNVIVLEKLHLFKINPMELSKLNANGLFFTQKEELKKTLNDGTFWEKTSEPESPILSSFDFVTPIATKSAFRFCSRNEKTPWVIKEFTSVLEVHTWRLAKLVYSPVSPARRQTLSGNEGSEIGEVHGHGGVTDPIFEIDWPFDLAPAGPVNLDNTLDVFDYLVDDGAEASQVAVHGGGGVGEESSKKLKLYFDCPTANSSRVIIGLNLKGIDYELKQLNLDKGDHCSPEFLNLNPLGYVPLLVDGDTVIGDTFAILMYLDEKFPQHPLLPKDVQKKALNYQVANFICSDIQPYLSKSMLEFLRDKLGTGEANAWAQCHMRGGLDALERLLKDCAGKYATGDEVFLADLLLAPQINGAISIFNVNMDEFPVLMRIFGSYAHLPAFQVAIGQV